MTNESWSDAFTPEDVTLLAAKMHEQWLAGHVKEEGQAKRFKRVPDLRLKGLAIERFRGQLLPKSGVRGLNTPSDPDSMVHWMTELVTTDGKSINVRDLRLIDCELSKCRATGVVHVHQNIAQDTAMINPALMDQLNGTMAKKYLAALAPLSQDINHDDLKEYQEEVAAIVHNVWVEEHKSWAPEQLQVPYSKLPEKEKDKDRVIGNLTMQCLLERRALLAFVAPDM
jgi:hypothetical protein